MKYLIILFLLYSFNSFAAGTESSTSETTADVSEQITKLYELAEKHIYAEKFDKSLKLLKKLTKREDLG